MKLLLLTFAMIAVGPVLAGEPSVVVHLLDHTGKGDTKDKNLRPDPKDLRKLYWIDWSDTYRPIEQSLTVTGEKATGLIEIMRTSMPETEAGDFCGHNPIYGVEATRADGTKFVTSICFECGTWVLPQKRFHMPNSEREGIRSPLALALRAVIELPKSVLDGDRERRARAAARKKQ